MQATKKPNKLITEKSPYLLQHAYNPVNWYPWCEEAFELAKKENKPIFLSVGYSTCHWCHVMEHESFEDEEVAKLMNDAFISIKVDREERPDIDSVYMTVCQMMTGSGGWPLTIIMTPDKKPFFAGTYFPKESRYGRAGMLDLVPEIKNVWELKNNEVLSSADEITSLLQKVASNVPGNNLGESILKKTANQLAGYFDEKNGGFGFGFESAPKFPTPHNLLFLLRFWKRTKEEKYLYMVEKTLQAMRAGGIYDHIGFGFHRYSTNSEWLLPHFEKMLYDQAILAISYTEAYQVTKKEEYKKTVEEIFAYVLRDMASKEGGFYSAEDADSEGKEGKFYVWTCDEIRQILTKEESELVIKVFNLKEDGNFTSEASREKSNANILHLKKMPSEKQVIETLENCRQKLFAARKKRIHPHKDDKILTNWNGLMIAALSKAAQVFNEEKYSGAAKSAANFILNKMKKNGELLHSYRDGQASINAHLDDYAFFVWGLLELYEATFEAKYLKMALDLNNDLIKHFWDDKDSGFYFTSDDDEKLIVRQKEIYDGAIPSGNSVSMLNLLKLARLTSNSYFEELGVKIGKAFSNIVNESPVSHTFLMTALTFAVGSSCEIVISGDLKSDDTKAMIQVVRQEFIPNKVVVLNSPEEQSPGIFEVAPYIKNKPMINKKTTAYICQNYACKEPTTEISKMLNLISQV